MRIAIINQFFWPDVAPTGQYLYDLACHLTAEGHDVTVICSGVTYSKAESGVARPPVRIIRVPGLPFKRGPLARLCSYAAFFIGACWYELTIPHPDILVSMTTPPLLGIAGAITKRIRGVKHFLWEMDVFPDALVGSGALRSDSLLVRFLGWVQDRIRNASDGIIVLGPCMQARLLARKTPAHLIHIAENWADGSVIRPALNATSGPLNVFYSGNFGVAHDTETIAAAICHFRNDPRFIFTFSGGGAAKVKLQQLCSARQIDNVRFLSYVSTNQINAHLAQADIGLVTERSSFVGTVVPSKTYGLMAASRPILFIGPQEATPAGLINRFGCGWQVDPGDVVALTDLLELLAIKRELITEAGQKARAAFDRHYDLRHGVARVAAALGLDPVDGALGANRVDRLHSTTRSANASLSS